MNTSTPFGTAATAPFYCCCQLPLLTLPTFKLNIRFIFGMGFEFKQGMCKVVMIDDNPIEHLIVRRISERDQLFESLDCVDDAGMVLDTLRRSEESFSRLPDIILLDLHMPLMSGWEFMKLLNGFYRDMKKTVNVYILSSSISEADRRLSLSYPFVKGFFVKPMTIPLLHQLSGLKS